MTDPPILTTTPPPQSLQSALPFTLFFVALHAALWCICLGLLVFYVPTAEFMFRDFNMIVPAATLVVFTLGRFGGNYWYILLIWLVFGLVFEGSLLAILYRRRRSLAWAWAVLNVVLPLLLIAFIFFAIESVRMKLLEGLSR